ncbi:PoNe immunity protein domain-containing protein [Pseudobutyrivibrio sp. MD2005]|uniref:PoNe immunity protein domain-containing protein n=1 Tax=Pseudobutyrivibrio sp. MD2005 TaxID=1410616 RepID=UPI0009E0A4FB
MKKVVEAAPEERITILNEYLEKKWYKSNRQQYWYDSHKSANNTYFGYWSFESAAVMKILGEDDSLLKDQKYYPYYMNHM